MPPMTPPLRPELLVRPLCPALWRRVSSITHPLKVFFDGERALYYTALFPAFEPLLPCGTGPRAAAGLESRERRVLISRGHEAGGTLCVQIRESKGESLGPIQEAGSLIAIQN